ncbi:hypothetical protein PMAYCL1PPCAC_09610, partial [Pristionchus mayeri]
MYSSDSFSFVYFTFGNVIYVLDTCTMELREPLTIEVIGRVYGVVGVFERMLTVWCKDYKDGNYFWATTLLPEEYCTNSKEAKERDNVQTLQDRIKEV